MVAEIIAHSARHVHDLWTVHHRFEGTEHGHLASGQELLRCFFLIGGVLVGRDRWKALLRERRTSAQNSAREHMSAAARRNMGWLLLSFPKFHQVWDSYREAEPGGLRRPRAMGGSLSATPRPVCGDRRFRQRRKALNQARD